MKYKQNKRLMKKITTSLSYLIINICILTISLYLIKNIIIFNVFIY